MTKRYFSRNVQSVRPAKNSEPGKEEIRVRCDLPEIRSILPGEAELVAQYLPDILKDVEKDHDQGGH